MNRNMIVSVKNMHSINVLDHLVDNYNRMGVILDGDCHYSTELLLRCSKYKVFDTKHYWLVLYNNSDYLNLFRNTNLNVDSDVKVVYPSENNDTYTIDDVYNQAFEKGGDLKSFIVGLFTREKGYQVNEAVNKYVVRRNLTGIQFDTLIVLSEPYEGPLTEYLGSDKSIQVDTLNRFQARLLQYCQNYYNFSVFITNVTNSWGYYQPDGTMDGVVGTLARKKIDFGHSPLVAKSERAKFISFGKGTWHLRMVFVLRNPNNKRSFEIFTRPFSLEVWICVITLALICVLSQNVSFRLDKSHRKDVDSSWSFSALCTLGAFCQQGITAVPNCLSGRTSGFIILCLGLLAFQFYSAVLVSFLLNVPVTVISTIQGILHSDFGLGYENVKYARSLLQQATNNQSKEIFRRVSANNNSGFLTRDEGLNLVKKGHFAFHVELVTGYPFIDKNFDLAMICELKEIPLFPPMYMYSGYQKWSPFKDVIDVCFQRFEEYGVMRRELLFWHPMKPQCVRTPSMIPIHTSLEDFYPPLVIWSVGVVLSLQILVYEILWWRRETRLKEPYAYTN